MAKITQADDYLAKHPQWAAELQALRAILLDTELEETIKWGSPVYTLGGKNVVGLSAFKSYVGLWFFQGGLLEDAAKVLVNAQEGKTQAMRQWRMHSLEEIDATLVRQYLAEAIAHQQAGRSVQPAPRSETSTPLPELLTTAFAENAALATAFAELTPYKQREYQEYIESAKRDATKASRLAKSIPLILAGKGLHDKYR